MGDYLRDQRISFLTIEESELEAINSDLQEVVTKASTGANGPSVSYVLRYDGMGIVRPGFDEIKKAFGIAKKVERIVLQVRSPNNYLGKGKNIEIHLDAGDINNCFLLVTDDNEEWVDSIFRRLISRLEKCRNGNWAVYSPIVELLIQLVGVTAGFLICLIAANLLSPLLNIKYSFWTAPHRLDGCS